MLVLLLTLPQLLEHVETQCGSGKPGGAVGGVTGWLGRVAGEMGGQGREGGRRPEGRGWVRGGELVDVAAGWQVGKWAGEVEGG